MGLPRGNDPGSLDPGPLDPDDANRTVAMPALAAPPEGSPARDLADVWDLLDELPPGAPADAAAVRLMATTVQMAAGDPPRRVDRDRGRRVEWAASAAVVVAALVTGLAAGRLTAPNGEARLAQELPYVQHLDLLREAGSVRFLEALTARESPPPFRLLRPPADAAEREEAKFRAALASLADQLAEAGAGAEARRREAISALSLEERVDLEKAARAFARMSATERLALEALAAALADPSREDLREAALDWHQWLQVVRPEDRERVVTSATDKRLEWIDWYASRMDGRMRPGFPDRPPAGGPPGFRPFAPRVRPDEPGPRSGPEETPRLPR
jgi:hypothetical protein